MYDVAVAPKSSRPSLNFAEGEEYVSEAEVGRGTGTFGNLWRYGGGSLTSPFLKFHISAQPFQMVQLEARTSNLRNGTVEITLSNRYIG